VGGIGLNLLKRDMKYLRTLRISGRDLVGRNENDHCPNLPNFQSERLLDFKLSRFGATRLPRPIYRPVSDKRRRAATEVSRLGGFDDTHRTRKLLPTERPSARQGRDKIWLREEHRHAALTPS
jgi:hypothetical protein